jgi:hypothetical protein
VSGGAWSCTHSPTPSRTTAVLSVPPACLSARSWP